MKEEIIMDILNNSGALISGHFELSSGLHSNKYVQSAKVFQYPKYTIQLGRTLSNKFRQDRVSIVMGIALGSIVLAHEVAKAIGAKSVFVERENGVLKLRRDFEIKDSDRVLIVEDVITTGESVREAIGLIKGKCRFVGTGALLDRARGYIKLGPKYKYLVKLKMDTFEKDKCSLCEKEVPLIKPGSRRI